MHPRKILIVDDSKVIHKMYGILLRQFTLLFADNGLDALEIMGKDPEIDLILLDINMPQMNGFNFLREIKGSGPFQVTPVIIVSIEGKSEEKRRCLEAGAVAYFEKPINTKKLLALISDL